MCNLVMQELLCREYIHLNLEGLTLDGGAHEPLVVLHRCLHLGLTGYHVIKQLTDDLALLTLHVTVA